MPAGPTRCAQGMRTVPAELVAVVREGVAARTGAALMTSYGISYNTWRKIAAGDPIRRSVADRLERRLRGGGG